MNFRRLLWTVAAGCWWFASPGSIGAQNPIFPDPFLIEHRIVQIGPGGEQTDVGPTTDYYGGSWVVSVGPDGMRTIVDFSNDRLTLVDVENGRYSTVTFERLARLRRRYRTAEFGSGEKAERPTDPVEVSFVVSEKSGAKSGMAGDPGNPVLERPGTRRFRVRALRDSDSEELATLDFWVDPHIRLASDALNAIERFERSVLGRPIDDPMPAYHDLVAEGRRGAGGALIVATSRPMVFGKTVAEAGRFEDRPIRIERLESFPTELLEIPEHFERVPHPLEAIVEFAEREAELRLQMSQGR